MISRRFFSFLSKSNGNNLNLDVFSKNGSQLSQTIRIASQKRYDDLKFWNLAKTRFQYLYKGLNGRNLAFIANGFARANITDNSIWNSIISRSNDIIHELDIQDLALLLNAMCKIEGIDKADLTYLIMKIKSLREFVPRYSCMIMHSLGKIKKYDSELVNLLLESIKPNLNRLTLVSISNLVNSFYNLKYYDKDVMKQLIEVINCKMSDTTNYKLSEDKSVKTLVSIYQGYAYSGVHNRELYSNFFNYFLNNAKDLKIVEIIIIANSMKVSKCHSEELIEKMSKKLINSPRKYNLDNLSSYLQALSPKYSTKANVEKVMKNVEANRFTGNFTPSNSVTLLQVYNNFDIENENLLKMLMNSLKENTGKLTELELMNVICCCKVIEESDLEKFLELFISMDNSVQNLSRVLYYTTKSKIKLSKIEDEIIEKLAKSKRKNCDSTVTISNLLCGLKSIKDSDYKNELINQCIEYVKENYNKFTNQLLASSLDSINELGRTDEILDKFIKNIGRFKEYKSYRDNVTLLKMLNSINYFKFSGSLESILKSYQVILNNVKSCEKGDMNEGSELEEKILEESSVIVQMLLSKLKVENRPHMAKQTNLNS
ncbi:hypothetical protein TpMuguga_01g02690 [Theileria parva strain Muguga]|uniref:uncharacterized protein n=1 Tax=Theileria parva strain Muguga TaxID=333668 RepID=UPI001C6232DD|nr:uncharacterized protein TpMuguga_01g02690 [Theileria parva strain Muguga]KAF5153429.1 hypothetical protein TpMuguga_01g02690 [Theileria parva strain Muguga]